MWHKAQLRWWTTEIKDCKFTILRHVYESGFRSEIDLRGLKQLQWLIGRSMFVKAFGTIMWTDIIHCYLFLYATNSTVKATIKTILCVFTHGARIHLKRAPLVTCWNAREFMINTGLLKFQTVSYLIRYLILYSNLKMCCDVFAFCLASSLDVIWELKRSAI